MEERGERERVTLTGVDVEKEPSEGKRNFVRAARIELKLVR